MYVCVSLRRGCDGLFSYCIISWGGCVYQGRLNIVDINVSSCGLWAIQNTCTPPHTHMCNRKFTWQYTVQSKESAHELSHTLKPNLLFSVKSGVFFALLPHSCVWTCPHSYRPKMNTRHRVKGALGGRACCWHSFNIIYLAPEEKHHSCPLLFINHK